jgi:hypothetical protein
MLSHSHKTRGSIRILTFVFLFSFFIVARNAVADDVVGVEELSTFDQPAETESNERFRDFQDQYDSIMNSAFRFTPQEIGQKLSALFSDHRELFLESDEPPIFVRIGPDGNPITNVPQSRAVSFTLQSIDGVGSGVRTTTRRQIEALKVLRSHFPKEFKEAVDESYRRSYRCLLGEAVGAGGEGAAIANAVPEVCPMESYRQFLLGQVGGLDQESKQAMQDLLASSDGNDATTNTTHGNGEKPLDACRTNKQKILAALVQKMKEVPSGTVFVYSSGDAVERSLRIEGLKSVKLELEVRGAKVMSLSLQCETAEGIMYPDLFEAHKKVGNQEKSLYLAKLNQLRPTRRKSSSGTLYHAEESAARNQGGGQ